MEVPNDWYELDRRAVNAINEQGAIVQDVAGISDDTPQTRNLIKANSSEKDPGAILSINIDAPASLSPEDFTGMTNEVLAQSSGELREGFESMARAGGFSFTKFYGAHLDKFGEYPAVVIEYQRTGIVKPGDFVVQINQIAMKGKTVRLTMSYRIADAFIWKARMARIRKSLALHEAP